MSQKTPPITSKTLQKANLTEQLQWLKTKIQISNNYNLNLILEEHKPNISSVEMMQELFKSIELLNRIYLETHSNRVEEKHFKEWVNVQLSPKVHV